jgi:uncharacterized protein (DUF952 family)
VIHEGTHLTRLIYKIVSAESWRIAEQNGVFPGSEIDMRDGYIHFSASHQVRGTLEKHFQGQADLLLVTVDVSAVEDGLRWEPSRGGDLFPHLYRDLKIPEASSVEPIDDNREFLNRAEFSE